MSASTRPPRPRLSVVMIVRDAAELLGPTLASVDAVADEILIVDLGSEDDTPEVARKLGATVLQRPWVDDFSKSRNNAAAHARGEWILWLEAGETLAAADAQALKQFLDTMPDADRAYALLVVVPPEGANISGEQVAQVRLVPNRPDLKFQGRLRESLDLALCEAGMKTEGLPWRIHRGRREHDPQVKLARARRDLKLVELAIREQGQLPELLVILGETLQNLGDRLGATAAFRNALQAAGSGSSQMRAAYYGLLSVLDDDPSQQANQMSIGVEALEVFPLDAQLLCAMGGYLQSQGRLDLAARSYQVAFEHGQVDPQIWHVSEIDDIAAVCWSLTLQLVQQDDEAVAVLERALTRNPSSQRVRRQLIELHIKHDRRQQALAEFDKLPSELPHRELLRSTIRGACLAAKQNWIPAVAYLKTAYEGGCRDPLCLRWLSVALVSTGATDEAVPILRQWREVEPRSIEAQKYLEAAQDQAAPAAAAPQPAADRALRIDSAEPRSTAPGQAPNLASGWPTGGSVPNQAQH